MVHHLLPHLAAAPGAYGLVGMGAVFASAARAPITALVIIFELTGDYRIILPLMVAIVVSTALSNAVTRDTIYTLKLRRRGVELDAPQVVGRFTQMSVGDAMGRAPRPLRSVEPLHMILARFAGERLDSLPIVDSERRLAGIISALDVERALSAGRSDAAPASELARSAPALHASDSLDDAIIALGAGDDEGIAVIDADERLIGWLTHRRLLRSYRDGMQRQRSAMRLAGAEAGPIGEQSPT